MSYRKILVYALILFFPSYAQKCCNICLPKKIKTGCKSVRPILGVRPICPEEMFFKQQSPYTAGKRLLDAALQFESDQFKDMLDYELPRYRNNKQALFDILNYRSEDGYNLMHLFIRMGDLENLELLFNTLNNLYADTPQDYFQYLMTRDTMNGLTIVGLAQETNNRYVLAFILMRIYDLLHNRPDEFFKIMYATDTARGWHPLINAVDDSAYEMVLMMLTVSAKVLDEYSAKFKRYINRTDSIGDRALDLAKTRREELLLESFGAQRTTTKEETSEANRIHDLSLRLINFSNKNVIDTQKFEELIDSGMNYCQTNEQLVYKLFNTQDQDGWTPIMHVASAGQYGYMRILLNKMEQCTGQKYKDLKYQIFRLTDSQGRSPLHLVIFRKHFRMARKLFDYLIKDPTDKPLLFSILNLPTDFNGFSPLAAALFIIGGNDTQGVALIRHMVESVVALYGRNSRYMYMFLNTRDYSNLCPLAYIISANIRAILREYGATDFPLLTRAGIDEYEDIMNMYADLTDSSSQAELQST